MNDCRTLRTCSTLLASVTYCAILGTGIVSCRPRPVHHQPRPGERTECVVAEPESRAMYAQLALALRGGDCVFDGLRTDNDRVLITVRDGRDAIPPVIVAHAGCHVEAMSPGARYGAIVPASAASRCPGTVARIRAALDTADAR